MLKDVTLGRYYPTASFLHALDPRTKLFTVLLFVISVFVADTPLLLALTGLFLLVVLVLSKVPFSYMTRGLKSLVFILIVADLLNLLLVEDGGWKAILITIRMVEVIFISNTLSLTTKPRSIADGLEKALAPLSYLKIPVHDLATMVSIAFRFIPILTEEAERVMEAQKARGADFESGSLIQRTKALVPILVPLFVSAFRRADELALAMDSRLYGSGEHSSLHPLAYQKKDGVVYLLSLLYFLIVVLLRVKPWI